MLALFHFRAWHLKGTCDDLRAQWLIENIGKDHLAFSVRFHNERLSWCLVLQLHTRGSCLLHWESESSLKGCPDAWKLNDFLKADVFGIDAPAFLLQCTLDWLSWWNLAIQCAKGLSFCASSCHCRFLHTGSSIGAWCWTPHSEVKTREQKSFLSKNSCRKSPPRGPLHYISHPCTWHVVPWHL